MIEKILLIQERILQLEDIIERTKAGIIYNDLKWVEGILHLNQRLLVKLKLGLPIEFSKVEEPTIPRANSRDFFLSKEEVIRPFLGRLVRLAQRL
jgi:hypothetical protein